MSGSSGGQTTLEIAVEMTYEVQARTEMLLQIEAVQGPFQKPSNGALELSGATNIVHGPAEAGIGRRTRCVVEKELSCTYRTRVDINRPRHDLHDLPHTGLTALPNETLRYLMPSRYCAPADFAPTAEDLFGDASGGKFVKAVQEWVSGNFAYVPGSSTSDTTASDTFLHRQGICRDYAHVVIALARARGIPARFVACYAPDVTPQDFHAVAEVWLGDGWHLIDATDMSVPENTVRIGVGMDAAEVAFLTVFGAASLVSQTVDARRLRK